MTGQVEVQVRGDVGDVELNALHAAAFGHESMSVPWLRRLHRHSLLWVTARQAGHLVGFVNVVGDGGAHAVLLDTCVDPSGQGQGIGTALVAAAAEAARERGCHWLHADYDAELAPFYEEACGLRRTRAGLLRLV